jgi:hypothetical protein
MEKISSSEQKSKRLDYQLTDSAFWESRVLQGTIKEIGVRDHSGCFHRFEQGEQFVLKRAENDADRKPFIRLINGEEISFYDWWLDKIKKNEETFREADPDYAELYMYVIDEYPEMRRLNVISGDKKQHPILEFTGGFFKRPTEEEPAPSIIVAMNDVSHYEKLMVERELSARRAADLIGITFDVLKARPEILKYFIFLHEIGHAHEYINDYFNNPEFGFDEKKAVLANRLKRNEELNALPVSGENPVLVRKKYYSGELASYYEARKNYYQNKGSNSPEELMLKHEQAYRDLPTEKYADEFAAHFLRKMWDKIV